MPTGTEERLAILEQIVFNGLSVNQLQPSIEIQSNDSFPFYSSIEGKLVRIEYSDLLNILSSGDITFVTELDSQDPPQPTGRVLIRQQGITQVVIGKTAQSNQYNDLEGKPNFATEDFVNNADSQVLEDAQEYTDGEINELDFTLFSGMWDISTNMPALSNSTTFKKIEFQVFGADPGGTDFDFGNGDILLRNDDIILYNGTEFIKKVDNNQSSSNLFSIPASDSSAVRADVIYTRMDTIFNQFGMSFSSMVEGVSNLSNINGAAFCYYSDFPDKYLLVDFSLLDPEQLKILSIPNKIYNLMASKDADANDDDIVGRRILQARFCTNPFTGISGVPANYTVFEITFGSVFPLAPPESASISINQVGDFNGLITDTFVFEDRDFVGNELINLLPAPGPNKLILPVSFSISINLTQGYEGSQIFNLLLGDYNLSQIFIPTSITNPFFDQSALPIITGDDGSDSNNENIINKPLEIRPSLSMSAGLGLIKVHITYRIIEL